MIGGLFRGSTEKGVTEAVGKDAAKAVAKKGMKTSTKIMLGGGALLAAGTIANKVCVLRRFSAAPAHPTLPWCLGRPNLPLPRDTLKDPAPQPSREGTVPPIPASTTPSLRIPRRARITLHLLRTPPRPRPTRHTATRPTATRLHPRAGPSTMRSLHLRPRTPLRLRPSGRLWTTAREVLIPLTESLCDTRGGELRVLLDRASRPDHSWTYGTGAIAIRCCTLFDGIIPCSLRERTRFEGHRL